MSYETATIYFMSGTGNSYRVATWTAASAADRGAETHLVQIEKGWQPGLVETGSTHLMGIVMPTHGFTTPWHMLKFTLRIPRRSATHAFCISTRAGAKAGRVFTPGLAGTATFVVALILALKGFKVLGVTGMDMPSNWTQVHPGFKEATARAIIERARARTSRFMNRILSGGSWWPTWGNLYDLAFGIPLLPISVLYLLVGRIFLAKLFFASDRCNACGQCAKHCPVSAVKLLGKKKPRPFWSYNCESCMRCMAYCKRKAVEWGHSWGVALYFITTIPVVTWLMDWLVRHFSLLAAIDNTTTRKVLELLYWYPAMLISYWLFYLLTRISLVNKLFTYTTFTRIFRRYHEPDTKLKHIALERDKT